MNEAIVKLIRVALGHSCCYGDDEDLANLEEILKFFPKVWNELSEYDRKEIDAWRARVKPPVDDTFTFVAPAEL